MSWFDKYIADDHKRVIPGQPVTKAKLALSEPLELVVHYTDSGHAVRHFTSNPEEWLALYESEGLTAYHIPEFCKQQAF
jgi:hypothetical protein